MDLELKPKPLWFLTPDQGTECAAVTSLPPTIRTSLTKVPTLPIDPTRLLEVPIATHSRTTLPIAVIPDVLKVGVAALMEAAPGAALVTTSPLGITIGPGAPSFINEKDVGGNLDGVADLGAAGDARARSANGLHPVPRNRAVVFMSDGPWKDDPNGRFQTPNSFPFFEIDPAFVSLPRTFPQARAGLKAMSSRPSIGSGSLGSRRARERAAGAGADGTTYVAATDAAGPRTLDGFALREGALCSRQSVV